MRTRILSLLFVTALLMGTIPTSATTVTIGVTTVMATSDGSNANLLVAQPAALSATATIQSLSFYVTTPAGSLRLGIYDATGSGGGPGAKKAETNAFTPAAGWNTANVISPVSLAKGNYWIAYLASDNNLGFKVQNGGVASAKYTSYTFGVMPTSFSRSTSSCGCQWSLYATLNSASAADATAPSVPTALTATAVSSSQINLTWAASTDNTGVTGYKIFRNGAQINTSAANSYSDAGLAASTSYSYTVSAFDAAGNNSANSAAASTTTQAQVVAFGFSMSNGGNISATRGSSATNSITATLSSGSASALTFSASGLPSGATASFNPTSCSPTCTTTITLTAGASSPIGTTTTTVTATGGGVTHTTTFTFTVSSTPDTTPPTVSVSGPANNATVSGTTVTVSAAASDNVGVAGVQFLLDGASLNAEDTTAPYSTVWNSTTAANGTHTLSAHARDAAGNTALSASISVTVNNQTADTTPPSVPTNLKPTLISDTQINLTWTASTDNVAVTGYTVFRNGAQIATVNSGTSYSNTQLSPNTSYSYSVLAFDAANNKSAQTAPVAASTLADATPPTVSISSPAGSATVSGTISVISNASDDVGIAGVTFQVDGTMIGQEITTSPYAISLNTTTLSDGGHTLTATAIDTSNNKTTSALVSITVNNSTAQTTGTPTMIQHVSTATNYDAGEMGSPYFISLPNLTGAGNALVIGVSYRFNSGSTVRITDDKSNTWTAGPTTPASPASGQVVSRLFYALNVAGGTQKVTVTFNALVYDFQAVISEFYNVAMVSAADGSSGTTSTSGTTVTAGSLTTSTAGDLIYSYGFETNDSESISGFTAGSGFALLSADIERGSFAQYAVQTSAGAINPSIAVAGASNPFNSVAIALKSEAAGTPPPPGIRIVHIYHIFDDRPGTPLQFPTTGNLLVVNTAYTGNEGNIPSMASSPANTWTKAPAPSQGFSSQIWYAANAKTSTNMTLTPGIPAGGITLVIYDITGAAASPYDAAAGIPRAEQENTNNANLLGMPVITPSVDNELIIVVMANGMGPTTGMVGAGQVLDSITYGNEIDRDSIENADGYAHYYSSTTSPVSFGWVMNSSGPDDSEAVAIAFKSATSTSQKIDNQSYPAPRAPQNRAARLARASSTQALRQEMP